MKRVAVILLSLCLAAAAMAQASEPFNDGAGIDLKKRPDRFHERALRGFMGCQMVQLNEDTDAAMGCALAMEERVKADYKVVAPKAKSAGAKAALKAYTAKAIGASKASYKVTGESWANYERRTQQIEAELANLWAAYELE